MGKQWKQCQTLFLGAPKSLQMVTAAMKLKDTYSELHPVNEVNTKGQFFHASFGKKTPGSKYSSTSGLSPRGHLERQAEFHASTQDEA